MRVADCHYNIQETNKDISLNAIFQSKWKLCATVNAKRFSVYISVLYLLFFLACRLKKKIMNVNGFLLLPCTYILLFLII